MIFPWYSHDIPMIFPWYSHDIPIIFPLYSHYIPMIFPLYSHYIPMIFPWYSHDIPMIFPWYSHDIPMIFSWYSHDIPMIFPWYSHDIPMIFPWYSHDILMIFPWYSHDIPIISLYFCQLKIQLDRNVKPQPVCCQASTSRSRRRERRRWDFWRCFAQLPMARRDHDLVWVSVNWCISSANMLVQKLLDIFEVDWNMVFICFRPRAKQMSLLSQSEYRQEKPEPQV